ncbi:MAG: DUF4388 domain-containing protein [Acidimicrobiales bacterium]
MALQGTLETFALPDVLRLLASTKKTGQLRLTGGRGSGSIWLDGGSIIASEASGAPLADGAAEVVFELLRFKEGDFVFDADSLASDGGAPVDVEATLGAAEAMLDEWKSIEAVVPSLSGWVSLSAELPDDEVTLGRDRWAEIVAIGGGTTVGGLGDVLQLGELPVSRTVKELIELGLVTLGEAPAGAASAPPAYEAPVFEPTPESAFEPTPEPAFEPAFEPTFEPSAEADDFAITAEPEREAPLLTVVDTPESPALDASFSSGRFDPDALVIEPPSFGGDTVSAEPEPVAIDDDPADAAEIARQLANLSPKAAKAVAAAAKATTQEEREAALAEVDDDEEPINRGLLLKFLGSVNG